MADYHVKIHCPIRNVEETVYFQSVEIDEGKYVKFNGCEIGVCDCQACNDCRDRAYIKLIDRT